METRKNIGLFLLVGLVAGCTAATRSTPDTRATTTVAATAASTTVAATNTEAYPRGEALRREEEKRKQRLEAAAKAVADKLATDIKRTERPAMVAEREHQCLRAIMHGFWLGVERTGGQPALARLRPMALEIEAAYAEGISNLSKEDQLLLLTPISDMTKEQKQRTVVVANQLGAPVLQLILQKL